MKQDHLKTLAERANALDACLMAIQGLNRVIHEVQLSESAFIRIERAIKDVNAAHNQVENTRVEEWN